MPPSRVHFSYAASLALGAALFLFIPAVLFFFVAHPAPIKSSLAAGVVLMLGHRLVALPYFRTVRPSTCAWCHRTFDERHPGVLALDLTTGKERFAILACERHADPTRRFFNFLDGFRWPLRAGIALPLLGLLAALAFAAFGGSAPLDLATDIFRLVIGITVQVVAFAPFSGTPLRAASAAFPVHNFYLLGIRSILWIFRLVGVWWIFIAGRHLLGL